jgi:NhaP-type Na+/H+ or K+/H+ antiporter
MGAKSDISGVIEHVGLPGVIVAAIAYVLARAAAPYFKYRGADRENQRKHDRLMNTRRLKAEEKLGEANAGKKGKKP